MQRLRYFERALFAAAGVSAGLLMTGCAGVGSAIDSTTGATVPVGSSVALQGRVHGGSQPIAGAQIFLYAAGTGGTGTATSLLHSTVVTDPQGNFSITGDYSCPSPSSQVYLLAKGGDTGGGVNTSSLLLSALGACGDLSSSTFVYMSEISTVASVYALQQFMTPGSMDISSSAGGTVGLANAFSTVNNLMDSSTGQARSTTVGGNGIVPRTTIHALANIMAACVNTRGTDAVCSTLFSNAPSSTGTAPADTMTAMLNIALNPGTTKGTTLYNLQPKVAPFQPALLAPPNDWTLSLEYSGGGMQYPEMPAVDARGNVWVPNAVSPGTLTELSPKGEPLSPDSGFSGGGLDFPYASAVDLQGNVWSANYGTNSVSAHANTGAALSSDSGYTANGMVQPNSIAIDGTGQVFTTNGNNTVSKLSSAGTALATVTNGGLDGSFSVAVDATENLWVANASGSTVSKFSNTLTAASTAGYSGGGLNAPLWVAVDHSGNAWLSNASAATVSVFSNTGHAMSSGYKVPATTNSLAIDGNNTVWTANSDGSISHLTSAGTAISPASGYISPDATGELGIVVDGSGNVWTTDIYVNSVFQFVGVAAPVVTPLAKAVQLNQLGSKP